MYFQAINHLDLRLEANEKEVVAVTKLKSAIETSIEKLEDEISGLTGELAKTDLEVDDLETKQNKSDRKLSYLSRRLKKIQKEIKQELGNI